MRVLNAEPDPADALVGPDHLAGGVLRSLSRNFRGQFSWGVVRTLLLGVISFGILPLVAWTRHLSQYVSLERQQLWHLGEWLRLQSANPDAATLPAEAEKIRWRGTLAAVAWVWLGAVAIFFATQLWHADAPKQVLISSTYGMRSPESPAFRADLFIAWTIGLSIAYGLHWLQVQLHAADVARFTRHFNRVAEWEGIPPLSVPRVGLGAQPLWMAGAFAMIVGGVFWSLPLMLAGAVQRRYISRTSGRLRMEAADRVRTMLLIRRPAMRVPTFVRPTILCRAERCRAPIPPLANFCARCGARAGTVMSDVA